MPLPRDQPPGLTDRRRSEGAGLGRLLAGYLFLVLAFHGPRPAWPAVCSSGSNTFATPQSVTTSSSLNSVLAAWSSSTCTGTINIGTAGTYTLTASYTFTGVNADVTISATGLGKLGKSNIPKVGDGWLSGLTLPIGSWLWRRPFFYIIFHVLSRGEDRPTYRIAPTV
jgi:hypothetical protein